MNTFDKFTPRPGDALLVVDLQRDFLPGGAMAVPRSELIVPVVRQWIEVFSRRQLPIFMTRDWHPSNHCSFTRQGGPWPAHCVAGLHGADFVSGLGLPASVVVVSKGCHPSQEAYSGFSGTQLEEQLRLAGVRRLFVCGLATDYCVRQTVEDALARNFSVIVLRDAVAAVDLRAGDGERALDGMLGLGAELFSQEFDGQILDPLRHFSTERFLRRVKHS